MAANELDSFVVKFKNLWRNGQEATLKVKSKDGEAWIELQVGLGHPLDLPPPHLQAHQRVQTGTSRDRRRARRAAERKNSGLKVSEEGTEKEIAEEASNSDSSNAKVNINSATGEVTVDDEETPEQAAAEDAVELLEEKNEKLNKDIATIDNTIEELNVKLKNVYEENQELKQSFMVTRMNYDGFRDEMKEKFGYDSDEEAEKNWQEILKKRDLERNKISCDKCEFTSKTEAGLKIHESKKHK